MLFLRAAVGADACGDPGHPSTVHHLEVTKTVVVGALPADVAVGISWNAHRDVVPKTLQVAPAHARNSNLGICPRARSAAATAVRWA